MKFLVISLAGIGDTLFATPLIHELRANFPDSTIEALVMWRGSADLLAGNPHLNAVHQKNLLSAAKLESLRFLWGLRRRRYDVSLNTHPQSKIQYRVIARMLNAPTRVSHLYGRANFLDRLLVNRTIQQDYQCHSIENNLAFLRFLNARPLLPRHNYEVFLSPADLAWSEQFIASSNLLRRPLLGIHIGSGGTKNLALRRWPLDHYMVLIHKLNQDRPEIAILLFGGPEEEKDHQRILAQCKSDSVFLAATANLRQAAALVKKCGAFLSVDTALMHLAAAMQVPGQVVIETPTWNKPIEPYGNPFLLVKNPAVAGRNLQFYQYDGRGMQGASDDLLRCMASVTVEEVYSSLRLALRPG